jgi:hypothetical protein
VSYDTTGTYHPLHFYTSDLKRMTIGTNGTVTIANDLSVATSVNSPIINIASGSTGSGSTDGRMWNDGTNLYANIAGQTQILNNCSVFVSGNSASLGYDHTDYVYNGGFGRVWTLPAPRANHKFTISNAGSFPLAITGGTNQIWDMNSSGATTSLTASTTQQLNIIGDGTYWYVKKF